jgi:small GTP-binding protein
MSFSKKCDHFQIKMVVLGDFATGKTSLLNRISTGKFDAYQEATIGAAFSSIDRESKYGTPVRYMVWDTAGQERYRALTSLYFRNADVILICFDVSSPSSFTNIKGWLNHLSQESKRKDTLVIIVANKNDLEWKIKKDDLEAFVKKENLNYYITSALQNIGTDELMDAIVSKCEDRWRSEMLAFMEHNGDTFIISDNHVDSKSESCCLIS